MHLSPQTLAAAGNSPWMIPNPMLQSFTLGLGLTFSSNANLTAGVQHTFDDPLQNPRGVSIARAGTVATVTDNGHNLNVGDSITVFNAGDPNLNGTYDVATVVDQNTYTYTVVNTGAVASIAGTTLISYRVFPHATLTGILGAPPARADGNYAFPVGAFRLRVTAYTAGSATLNAMQGLGN